MTSHLKPNELVWKPIPRTTRQIASLAHSRLVIGRTKATETKKAKAVYQRVQEDAKITKTAKPSANNASLKIAAMDLEVEHTIKTLQGYPNGMRMQVLHRMFEEDLFPNGYTLATTEEMPEGTDEEAREVLG